MTFDELIRKVNKTELEAMLCQAIVVLSTQPKFEALTPWEILDYIANTCQVDITRLPGVADITLQCPICEATFHGPGARAALIEHYPDAAAL